MLNSRLAGRVRVNCGLKGHSNFLNKVCLTSTSLDYSLTTSALSLTPTRREAGSPYLRMTFSYEVLKLPCCIDNWHYVQYSTKRSHSICAAEQYVNAIWGSFHEHKFTSDIQQLIKGGQTFEGRAYLIELRSDIELWRWGRDKSEHSDLQLLFPLINPLIRINWGKGGLIWSHT